MENTQPGHTPDTVLTAAAVLADARELRAVSLAAEAALLDQAARWADLHPVPDTDLGATFHHRGHDTGMALTADGLPDVASDCVAEHAPEAERRRLAAADGRDVQIRHDTTGTRHGLSDIWGRLDLPDALALDAAITHGASTLARLGSTDPLSTRRARALGDLARHQPSLDLPGPGDHTSSARTSATAHTSAGDHTRGSDPTSGSGPGSGPGSGSGSTGRSGHASADADGVSGTVLSADPTADQPARPAPGRVGSIEPVVLYLHLSAHALTTGNEDGSGQVENTRCPITAGQVREWCHRPEAQITVRPVIDLNHDTLSDRREVPGRIREHIALRDRTCVFPLCSRPARPYPNPRASHDAAADDERSTWRVDADHIHPHADGGPTSTDNTAPLCRIHHLLKTFPGWRYTVTSTRSYHWTSPHHLRHLRTPDGATHDLGDARAGRGHRPPDQLSIHGTTGVSGRSGHRALRPPGRHREPLPYQRDPVPAGPARAEPDRPPPF